MDIRLSDCAAKCKKVENSIIYKDECIYSFDTKFSPNGIYICLKNHVAVGYRFLDEYSASHDCHVFLNFRSLRTLLSSSSETSPKRLAIGVQGGFSTQPNYSVTDKIALILMPGHIEVAIDDDIPRDLRTIIDGVINGESAYIAFEKEKHSGKWEGDEIMDSQVAFGLFQEDSKKVDLTNRRCLDCDLETNLWLNLSDGSIRCGRGYFDGTGGNNHSLDHFQKTDYPLVVKLGTICPNSPPDIFSYVEATMVRDPLLKQHLQHWGIDIDRMVKTDKTMTELEIELNSNHKWASIMESNNDCPPLWGPGLTGVHNIGNTCYIACILQVFSSISPIYDYYTTTWCTITSLPISRVISGTYLQLGKVVNGLGSGLYSPDPVYLPNGDRDLSVAGIHPHSYVHAFNTVNGQFGNGSQQDACEFMESLIRDLSNSEDSLARVFSFQTVDTIRCCEDDHPLKQIITDNTFISLYLTNGDFGGDCFTTFSQCLERFSNGEFIDNYYSPVVDRHVRCHSTTCFVSFPQILVVRLCRFTVDSSWRPYKIDSPVEMPEVIDLTHLLSSPPRGDVTDETDQLLSYLMSMGYDLKTARTALMLSKNDLNEALDWLVIHGGDYSGCHGDEKHTSGVYRMFAFVSHVGKSTECGHYLCHIMKNGGWTIFDDAKVCQSVHPRPDLGYIFFYERL